MPDDKSIIKKWKRREDVATMAEWGKDGRRAGGGRGGLLLLLLSSLSSFNGANDRLRGFVLLPEEAITSDAPILFWSYQSVISATATSPSSSFFSSSPPRPPACLPACLPASPLSNDRFLTRVSIA